MQCKSNTYLSIAYSVIAKPSIWKSWDLHYILEQGIMFKSVGIRQPVAVNKLAINFKIKNFDLNGVMLDHESHLIQNKNKFFDNFRHLNQRNTDDGIIFTCGGFSVTLMWNKTSLFSFSIRRCNDQGFHNFNRKATLLEFRSMTSRKKFLKTFFIENVGVSVETQFNLQYISINLSQENKHQIMDSLGRKRK